jgi:hypothetical protein
MGKRIIRSVELLAWHIYDRHDHCIDVTPEKILDWILEMESNEERLKAHKRLLAAYDEYREAFMPNYVETKIPVQTSPKTSRR